MLTGSLLLALIAASAVAAPGDARDTPKLAVLPLQDHRLDPAVVKILDELLEHELSTDGRYDVISAADIDALLGFEKMKDAAGCDDVACAAQIGGALGATFLVTGSASSLSSQIILNLKLMDVTSSETTRRVQLTAPLEEKSYRPAIARLVHELLDPHGSSTVDMTKGAAEPPTTEGGAQVHAAGRLGPRDYATYESFIARADFYRYLDYENTAPGTPMSLDDWVVVQNRESWALAGAEIASGAAILVGMGISLSAGSDQQAQQTPRYKLGVNIGAIAAVTLIAEAIVDAFDIGAVSTGPHP